MTDARPADLAREAEEFCEASIRDWTGRAARMLAANPELAGYSFATAVVLGDVGRVRAELARDPGLATRVDTRTGWTALHAACASRWHRLDPARAGGLTAVARLLLDAGADPVGRAPGRPGRRGWTPLRCAVAGAANPPVVALLLERGAVPDDHDLYLAEFGGDDHESLRLMLRHTGRVTGLARQALAAPVSLNDAEGVRMLLEAGADPRRYADDDGEVVSAAYEAVRSGCSAELLELLLASGADPGQPGPDGRSPYVLATVEGRADLAGLLRRYGAADDTTDTDRFLAALQRADRAAAAEQLAGDPGLLGRVGEVQQAAALIRAAGTGNTAALALMLDLGFQAGGRGGEHGGTALHTAAYCGSADAVRLLLGRGADLEARDATWDSTPLEWASVGSGQRPGTNPRPEWIATVEVLLAAGASTEGITLSPGKPKQPSPEIAALLRRQDALAVAADERVQCRVCGVELRIPRVQCVRRGLGICQSRALVAGAQLRDRVPEISGHLGVVRERLPVGEPQSRDAGRRRRCFSCPYVGPERGRGRPEGRSRAGWPTVRVRWAEDGNCVLLDRAQIGDDRVDVGRAPAVFPGVGLGLAGRRRRAARHGLRRQPDPLGSSWRYLEVMVHDRRDDARPARASHRQVRLHLHGRQQDRPDRVRHGRAEEADRRRDTTGRPYPYRT
jgi:ankyrin repeat protein